MQPCCLPSLTPPEFPAEIRHLYEEFCGWDLEEFTSRDVPERHELLRRFPLLRATKKGRAGKPRSTQGYVWVETDPACMLFNRMVCGSCHTPDSDICEGERSAGNLNWIYSPYFATVFAHRDIPKAVPAVSPITEETFRQRGGEVFEYRSHQAAANIWLMANEQNRPVVYLCSKGEHNSGRIYDSCYDYPWEDTILRYLTATCKRAGIGLALDSAWKSWAVSLYRHPEFLSQRFPRVSPYYDKGYFRTPEFKLFRGRNYPCYGDGSFTLERTCVNDKHVYCGQGYGWEVVSPKLPALETESPFSSCYHWHTAGCQIGDTGTLGERESSSRYRCCECGDRVREDDTYCVGDSTYCEACYDREFTCCYHCEEPTARSEAKRTPHGEDCCRYCFNDRYHECKWCYEAVRQDRSYAADGDTWCESCYYDTFTLCDCCDEPAYNEDVLRIGEDSICCDCRKACPECGKEERSDELKPPPDSDTPVCRVCQDDWNPHACRPGQLHLAMLELPGNLRCPHDCSCTHSAVTLAA